jgi:hypothetical protein
MPAHVASQLFHVSSAAPIESALPRRTSGILRINGSAARSSSHRSSP